MSEEKKVKRGRKPVSDKKQPVVLYIHESVILACGGPDELKRLLVDQALKMALFGVNVNG